MREVKNIKSHVRVLSKILTIIDNTKFVVDSDDLTFYDCGGASTIKVNESSTEFFYSCYFYIDGPEYTENFKQEYKKLMEQTEEILGKQSASNIVNLGACGTQFRAGKSNRTIVNLHYTIRRK